MKLTWKNQNKKHKRLLLSISTLPFNQNDDRIISNSEDRPRSDNDTDHNIEPAQTHHHNDTELAKAFHAQGNKLAEDGRYHEALGKWEAAITLMPERAVLHEQKAQVLLEIGEAWNALKAATRRHLELQIWRMDHSIHQFPRRYMGNLISYLEFS